VLRMQGKSQDDLMSEGSPQLGASPASRSLTVIGWSSTGHNSWCGETGGRHALFAALYNKQGARPEATNELIDLLRNLSIPQHWTTIASRVAHSSITLVSIYYLSTSNTDRSCLHLDAVSIEELDF